jgi:hypothetical protein
VSGCFGREDEGGRLGQNLQVTGGFPYKRGPGSLTRVHGWRLARTGLCLTLKRGGDVATVCHDAGSVSVSTGLSACAFAQRLHPPHVLITLILQVLDKEMVEEEDAEAECC